MTATTATDFRDAAAEQSAIALGGWATRVSESESSLCVRIAGAPAGPLYRIALVPWTWLLAGLLLFLAGVVLGILILTPLVDARLWSVGLAAAGVVLGVVLVAMSEGAARGTFDGVMEARLGQRLKELKSRVEEPQHFAVEDPATYKKQKVISEDYALGGPDRLRPGLLLEGIRYRYVVRPGDVTEVREDGDHLLITYRVREAPVTMAVTVLSVIDDEKERRIRESIRLALVAPG